MTAELAIKPRCGAPTLYREEYPDMLVEYFESRPWGLRTLTSEGDSSKDAARVICSEVPTFQGFCQAIGVTPQTLCDWDKRHAAFAQARARAKAMQEVFFVQGLATGLMNPTGAVFVAKNILGWKDKTEVETINSQDTEDANTMRQIFAQATPAELAQMSALISGMQARARLTVTESGDSDTEKPAL